MARNLKTGWVIIATSGPTVDGRVIKKEWLEDMAATYKESLYSAKIWPDHKRYFGAQGKVVELKLEPAKDEALKGEVQLMAILAPTDDLVYANRRGNYTHSSIEVLGNFRGTGKFYLGGMAATDEPASVGTSELNFSADQDKFWICGPEVSFSDVEESENDESWLVQKFRNLLNKENGESQETAMDKEQFNQLVEGQNKIATALTAMIEKFTAKPPAKNEDDDKSGGDKNKTNDDGKGEFVSKKDYDDLAKKLTDLDTKFTELKNTPIPGTNGLENLGDIEAEI